MTDIATISLRVNTDEVERGNKVLDEFGRAAQDTAKKSDDLNRVFKTGPQATKPATASIKEQREELQKLLDKISPVNRALNQLDEMQEKLRAASKKGLLPSEDFDHYNDILEKTRDKITGVGKETEKLGLKSTGVRREIGVLIGELARGNIGALRGSGITLANRAGWIDQLMTLKGLGIAGVVGGIATAVYALGKAWYQGNQESTEFNKQLILTGNYAGKTTDQLNRMAKAVAGGGLTRGDAAGVLAKVVGSGKFSGKELEQVTRTAAVMEQTVGHSVDATIASFEKLKDAPTKASEELNSQLHYLSAAQYQYISTLEAKGQKEEAAAAAEQAYSDAMQGRMENVRANLGTIELAADAVTRSLKSVWDMLLNIGRETSATDRLATMNSTLKEINDNVQGTNWLDRAWGRFKNNAMGVDKGQLEANIRTMQTAITLQDDLAGAQEEGRKANEAGIKAQQVANRWREAGTTAAEKRAKAEQELNKAIAENARLAKETANLPADQRVQQWTDADIEKMRAGIAKTYKDPRTPKKPAVKVYASDRASENAQKELLALQSQLDMLEKHREANDTISAQRKALWQAESQYAVLQKAAGERQLTVQEKQLLAGQKETLEYKRQLAELGDKVASQERLNKLHQQATKFIEQQSAKQKQLDALADGATTKEAERAATRDRLSSTYGNGEEADRVLKAQEATWKKQDELQGNWRAGAKAALSDWAEAAQNSYQQVGDFAANTFDGMNDVLGNFLTTGKAGFKDFVTSAISDLAKMLLKMGEVQLMQATLGGTEFGSLFGFAGGGYTGEGGKYEPKGVVHGGEFVFTKEATNRLGVNNLYALMRGAPGFAEGGYVGTAPRTGLTGGGITGGINVSTSVVVQAGGQQGGSDPTAGKALEAELKRQMDEAARAVVNKAVRNGGVIWNFVKGGR